MSERDPATAGPQPLKQYSDLLDQTESNLTAALSLVQAQKQWLKVTKGFSAWPALPIDSNLQLLSHWATLDK